jgi:hypothetical protein
MALQTTTNINVDFYDKKYIMINAKQYDSSSRWIAITCYNKGDLFNLSANNHSAYIKYRKADGHGVLNACRINYRGEVLVELTEQMLAADGICYADLMIVNKGSAMVNVDTGEIITVDGSAVLSTMAFCVNVYEPAFDNSLVESSYELDALNTALQKAEANYTEVIQLAKSYATGDTNMRENEDWDNSKYYSQMSKSYAIGNANGIRKNEDVDNSKYYRQLALESAEDADISKTNAAESANSAIDSAESASQSAKVASESATIALESGVVAKEYMDAAKNNMATISNNAAQATESAAIAAKSATDAQTYYLQVEEIANGLSGAFNPKGTVEFAELATLLEDGDVKAGDLYNIRGNFTTDESFKRGAGIECADGTNVYYTSEGYWDCLSGTGVVTGVKGDKESEYRKGNINLTVDNIGAISADDISSVDETIDFLKVYAPLPDDVGDAMSLQADMKTLKGRVDTFETELNDFGDTLNTTLKAFESDFDTELGSFRETFEEELSGFEDTLNTSLNDFGSTLDTKLGNFEDTLDTNLDNFEVTLNEKLDKLENYVETEVAAVQTKVDALYGYGEEGADGTLVEGGELETGKLYFVYEAVEAVAIDETGGDL